MSGAAPVARPWAPVGRSTLRFAVRDGVTRLVAASAAGPLRVIRAEPGPVCGAAVVQVRGGLCDGDRWSLVVELEADARVRLRGVGALLLQSGVSGCRTTLRLHAGARLSWLSPGVIALPGSSGALVTAVEAAPRARAMVAESMHCAEGSVLRSHLLVRRGPRPVHEEWTELGRRQGPTRLGAATHLGTVLSIGSRTMHLPETCRVEAAGGHLGHGLSVARLVGRSLQELQALVAPVVESVHDDVAGTARKRKTDAHGGRPSAMSAKA